MASREDPLLVADADHLRLVVREGIFKAQVSLDIMTADFKAMLVPAVGSSTGRHRSVVQVLAGLAERGVEVRLLHSGVPSAAALRELRQLCKKQLPQKLLIRRCPRLHAKAVIVDTRMMYVGSANLTGAGLGAKGDRRRNFELGIWTRSVHLIDATLEHFNKLWEGANCAQCQRRDICPEPLEEPRLV